MASSACKQEQGTEYGLPEQPASPLTGQPARPPARQPPSYAAHPPPCPGRISNQPTPHLVPVRRDRSGVLHHLAQRGGLGGNHQLAAANLAPGRRVLHNAGPVCRVGHARLVKGGHDGACMGQQLARMAVWWPAIAQLATVGFHVCTQPIHASRKVGSPLRGMPGTTAAEQPQPASPVTCTLTDPRLRPPGRVM